MTYKRLVVLYIENEVIGDGDMSEEVMHTVREYANQLEAGTAGRYRCEVSDGPRGTRLTAIGVAWSGERIPLPPPPWHQQPLVAEKAS